MGLSNEGPEGDGVGVAAGIVSFCIVFITKYLELELTESVIIKDVDITINILNEMKEMGIHLSIDDFGTGYSSLNYLKRLPITTLKIDRSFINDIEDDPDGSAIVKAIIAMAQNLKLKTIAEGVETKEQLKFLCTYGCDEIQGYYFSKPLPFEDICQMLLDTEGFYTSKV